MEVNFQNLLDTAKAEIKRKDALITQLRKEYVQQLQLCMELTLILMYYFQKRRFMLQTQKTRKIWASRWKIQVAG